MANSSWSGIHKCGGLLSAIPNTSNEEYFCSIESCKSEKPLDDKEYYIFRSKELPTKLSCADIMALSRSDRKMIYNCNSKDEAIRLALRLKNNDRLTTF